MAGTAGTVPVQVRVPGVRLSRNPAGIPGGGCRIQLPKKTTGLSQRATLLGITATQPAGCRYSSRTETRRGWVTGEGPAVVCTWKQALVRPAATSSAPRPPRAMTLIVLPGPAGGASAPAGLPVISTR